jgi:hypothetical protein
MGRGLACLAIACVLSLGSTSGASLIGWWTFDEGAGTVAKDSSGNGNNGSFVGHPQWAEGITGGVLRFDGSSYVDCGSSTRLELTGPLTIACWVNPAALDGDRGFVGRDGSYSFKASGTTLRFTTPGILDHTGGNSTLKVGAWQHVAVTFNPGQANGLIFYIHGIETDRMAASAIDAGTGPMRIGTNQWSQYFNGLIDDVRVYNEVLPAAEVKKLAFRPKAYSPGPANGASAVTQPLFTWIAGSAAQWHKLYLGTSPELTEADVIAPKLSFALYYHPAGLQPGVAYYWRVDEIAVDGTIHPGDVWTFTAAPVSAYSPDPRDGDKWIDTAATLTWQAGQGASEHAVYFGVDEAAVANRDPGVFAKTTFAAMYKPGVLKVNTLYFWAVDETTSAGVKHPGQVWRFTTAGGPAGVKGEYFAGMVPTGKPVLTRADAAIDFTWGDGGSPDASVPGDQFSVRWTADLEIAIADSYTFITHTDDGSRLWLNDQLIVDRWVDQGATDAPSKAQNLQPGIYPLEMTYYENGGAATARLFWQTPYIARQVVPGGPLQPPVRARSPRPAPSTVDVPQDLMLSWTAGHGAQAHDVYFGQDAQAVADATTATADLYRGRQPADQISFIPGDLEWNATYSWRVDEVASDGSVVKGPVWSFTTADFLVVDNMETYTDDEGSRIYQFWIDGLTTGDNGSTVGYLQAPFAEQTIVRSGGQSMPMDYDNTGSPYYSEAERQLDSIQNWTVNGLDSLTLWFRGNAVRFVETAPNAIMMSSMSGDVWDVQDHVRLVYKQLTGDGAIVVKVESMTHTAGWAKAGVMIRQSLKPGSTHALMMVAPDARTAFQNRRFADDVSASAHSHSGVVALPVWLKIERKGNVFTASRSTDGITWTVQGNEGGGESPNPETIVMSGSVHIGLAVTSNNLATACVAEFSGIQTTGAVSGSWQAADIGPAILGNDPSPLYVTVADSAGKSVTAIHPDPMAVTTTEWTQWNVPLSSLKGISLSKIDTVRVGVGDRKAAQPSGKGRIYIDDLRVTKP